MTQVFISYSRKDGSFVQSLQRALEEGEAKRKAWVDWEDIPPSAEWLKRICSAIDEADTFVFVLSPDSVSSETCRIEIDHASARRKKIIPVVRRTVEVAQIERVPAHIIAPTSRLRRGFRLRQAAADRPAGKQEARMSLRHGIVACVLLSASYVAAQQPTLPPLFFREEWRQIDRPANAPADFVPERGVTPAAVTNPNLELRLYDQNASSIPAYVKQPPTGSIARDWSGPSCIQLAGYNQNPPPATVAAGQATDPPNLWTGVCQTPVAATLRDRSNYVDLTGLARIRWVTRVSGFHVIRPVVKLADGTWLVGDYGEGAPSSNSTLFLQSEFAVANVRWLTLDITRVVTRGQSYVEKPDLSRVDEIGFADLLPGSGHGWGGFVNVARFEVYGRPVKR